MLPKDTQYAKQAELSGKKVSSHVRADVTIKGSEAMKSTRASQLPLTRCHPARSLLVQTVAGLQAGQSLVRGCREAADRQTLLKI